MLKKLCLIIPVYNNEESLKQLYDRLKINIQKRIDIDYNIIFVDDGSSDSSRVIIKEICTLDPKVTGIFLSNNFGQAAALCAGFDNSNGDYFGVLDADLEDPPEILHDMMNYLIEDKFDIIVANRISTKANIIRKIATKITYFIFKIAYRNTPKNGFNVWLMNKKMFVQFTKITSGFFQHDIYELGFRRKIISYERHPSKNIKSNQNILKLFTIFFEITIKSSEIFFKYIFIVGFFIFLFTIANFFYMIFEYLNNPGKNPKGLYAILTYISFFGSLNLLFLGIIGNFLLKIIKNNSKHKNYYIEEIINNSK